ncbi:MAG: RHS repeat domain-containing protein [Maioricimonas sp. JB045]
MMANTTGSYTATYDEVSRRRSVSTPAGHVLTYAYDSLSRRVELHSPAGRFTYSYDANNRPGRYPRLMRLSREDETCFFDLVALLFVAIARLVQIPGRVLRGGLHSRS